MSHVDGPGLKVVGQEKWYGGGYCGICGSRDSKPTSLSPLIPVRVRWWDPDDGWKTGVLCLGCGQEAAAHGPKETDCAFKKANKSEMLDVIDETLAGDDDGALSMTEDLQ